MMKSWNTLYANWKYDPFMVIRVRTKFSVVFLNLNDAAEIIDTLSIDDGIP